jgi:hypothetical protein
VTVEGEGRADDESGGVPFGVSGGVRALREELGEAWSELAFGIVSG